MLRQIHIQSDPARLSNVDIYDVPEGVRLFDWLKDHYGDNGFGVPTKIYKGYISQSTEIDIYNKDQMFDVIDGIIYIIHRPQWEQVAIAIVLAVISYALMPTPSIPKQNERRQRNSPNNQVFGQTNVARLLERVPDIFGEERSYPDLITPTVTEFVNHDKFLTEYMCIGRGWYDISDIKTGNTLVSDIPGSSVTFYPPGSAPTEVLRQQDSNEVKGQILEGPNAGAINPSGNPLFYDSTNDLGYFMTRTIGEYSAFLPGDNTVINRYVSYQFFYDFEGTYITNVVESWVYLTPTPFSGQTINNKFETVIRNSRIYALLYVQNPVPHSLSASWPSASNDLFQIANITGYADPVTYAASLSMTTATQTVMRDGIIYYPLAAELPFTTATWSVDKFRFVELENLAFEALSLLNAGTVNAAWTSPLLSEAWATQLAFDSPDAEISPENDLLYIGPFVVPGSYQDQIWLDIEHPKGLVKGSTLQNTNEADINVFVEEIDVFNVPTGTSFNFPHSFSDNNRDHRFWTIKINEFNSPMITGNKYRVSVARLNDESFSLTNLSETQWTRLAGITDITSADETGATRVILTTRATEQVASQQEKKLNMLVTRKVVTWNGVSVVGDISTGAGLTASRRFADILLHYMLDPKLGARSQANIDIPELYAIQSTLDGGAFSGEKGEFNYTFDSKNSPAINEMLQIAQACRVMITREGSFFSFIRDEAQTTPRALFNRRNKLPEGESKTIELNRTGDHDGVSLEYIDRRDYKPRTITLPDDLPIGDPNYGLPDAENAKKLESIGIKNYSQAWDRAQYEFNRLIHKRINVRTSVTEEGLFHPLNSRVLHVDGLRLDYSQTDGEIQAIDGLEITTDNRCIFEFGETYSVIFKDENGLPSSPIGVTAISGSEFGFILDTPSPFTLWVRGLNGYQKGTLYQFAKDGEPNEKDSYLIQRKTPTNGGVELDLINYAPEYYQADNQTPPPKA